MLWKLKIVPFKNKIRRTFGYSPRKIDNDEVKNIEMCNIIPNGWIDQLFKNMSQLEIQSGTRDYFVMQVSRPIVK